MVRSGAGGILWSANNRIFVQIEFQMAACCIMSVLGTVDMSIEGYDAGHPVIIHVVGMNDESGALEPAAGAEEPGCIFSRICI